MSAVDLHARASEDYSAKLEQSKALLQQIAADYPGPAGAPSLVSQASSLGAEDMVITHLINSLLLDIGIFVLETGQLHPETLVLLAQTQSNSRAPVSVFKPVNEAVLSFMAREGQDAMYQSLVLRKACCRIRKMEPLERALEGKTAWITGLRREQSGERAEVPLIDQTDSRRVKFNPLANWTWGDVWHYINSFKVSYNPLHDQFFPSIGCAPCTRAISLGEDFRSGRWWWESALDGGAAKECGLHVKPV